MTREEFRQKNKEWFEMSCKLEEEEDFYVGTAPFMTWEELNTQRKTIEEWTELAKKEEEAKAKAAAEAKTAGQ